MVDDCKLAYERLKAKGEVIAETEGDDGVFLTTAGDEPSWLILAKQHVENVAEFLALGSLIAKMLYQIPGFNPETDSYNLSLNFGRVAGQRVAHLHLWVIPRKDGQPASGWGTMALIQKVNANA